MASLTDPDVRELLEPANYAVVSTVNPDDSILSVVVWKSLEDGELAVNSAVGRRWPSNLQRDPRITVLVYPDGNPYDYVEVRGTAEATFEDAEEHIDRLAKLYTGADEYPHRQPGERRIKFVVRPDSVRHQKQR